MNISGSALLLHIAIKGSLFEAALVSTGVKVNQYKPILMRLPNRDEIKIKLLIFEMMKLKKIKIMKNDKLKMMIESYKAKISAAKKTDKSLVKAVRKRKKDFTNELHGLMHETIAPVIVPMLEMIASKKFYVEYPEFNKSDDGDCDFYSLSVRDEGDELETGFDLTICADYKTREIIFEMDPPHQGIDAVYSIEKITTKLVEDLMMKALQWFFVDRLNNKENEQE